MNIYAITAFLASLFCILLGSFVFIKRSEGQVNRAFLYLNITIGIWCLSTFLQNISKDGIGVGYWDKICQMASFFVPAVSLHFVFAVIKRPRMNIVPVSYLISTVFALLGFSPLFITKATPGNHHFTLGPGIFYPLYIIAMVIYLVFGFSQLAKAFFGSGGEERLRLKYILFAWIAVGFVGILIFYLQFYGVDIRFPHDVFVIAYFSILAYAIFKHQLMDITVAITRATIFVFVYALVLGAPFLVATFGRSWLAQWLSDYWWVAPLVLMATLGTIGPFIYIRLKRGVEAIILREQFSYQNALNQAAEEMARTLNLQKLLNFLVQVITASARISHAAIYLADAKNGNFSLKASRNLKGEQVKFIDNSSALIKWLVENKKPLVYEEFRRMDLGKFLAGYKIFSLANETKSLNATIVVPCFLEERLIGLILLGDKISGRIYSAEDLNTFSVLASQFALAVENASLYNKMEEQVGQRTQELADVQKQLIQAEKLASVGTLAGGVAHEINNPLTAILTNVQMLLADTGSNDPDTKESLELIEEATRRCRTIVQKLMAYAKKPLEGVAATFSEVDMLDAVKNAVNFLGFQFSQENIKITVRADEEDAYLVSGNQNELEQVITNVILNAKDAIKHKKAKGEIEIAITKTAKSIRVAISDDGPGIHKDIISKIFDPFFTTKDVGKGLGLGLSICHTIMDKHQGSIQAHSQAGEGATFIIEIPALKLTNKQKSVARS